MTRLNTVSLHYLVEKREINTLLKKFSLLMPGVELALIETNGQIFTSTPDWPRVEMSKLLPSMEEVQGIQRGNFFLQPLIAKSHFMGTVAVWQEGEAEIIDSLHYSLTLLLSQALAKRDVAGETLERYRELNLLYSIGETINASLDPDEIPMMVLREANRVIRAKVGLAILPTIENRNLLDIKASFGDDDQVQALYQAAQEIISRTVQTGEPAIVTPSALNFSPIGAILAVPLKTRGRTLGVVLLGRLIGQPIFTAGDEKLLLTLTRQAAVAMENAYLFADVRRQRDAVSALKSYADNIFASITSGIITTDSQDIVVTLNQAAERILEIDAEETKGQLYTTALASVGKEIAPLVKTVRQDGTQIVQYEIESELPERGQIVLRLHISPLQNSSSSPGVTIVMEDLTEQRQLQQQIQRVRQTFERYVAPNVVKKLLTEPTEIQLGGDCKEITTLFADIRNFTSISEELPPDILVEILNKHLTLAAEAILAEEGTLDKFMGDAVMAIFNAPLPQENHTLRAVRAALAMQRAVKEMHAYLPPAQQFNFGIGITVGSAIMGNIGSDKIQNYTAIGDKVNMAQRLQSVAKAGQILLCEAAYQQTAKNVIGKDLGTISLKGRRKPEKVFEVIQLREQQTVSWQ